MPSLHTGLALASLILHASADIPVVHTRVDCATHVTTSYLAGATAVAGQDGGYWVFCASVFFELFWTDDAHQKPGVPLTVDLFADYEHDTKLTVTDYDGFGFTVALDKVDKVNATTQVDASDKDDESTFAA
ncbi:hypothetical protein BJY04DRAFT_218929 [Aspergillus karnatakaensis]|uniref:uncharacterized protein n=1 Tax=Aspergillus karnatakaensis TaxID=1810916 RepID=UPI003CCD9316